MMERVMIGFPPKARGNDNHLFCCFNTVSHPGGRIGIQKLFSTINHMAPVSITKAITSLPAML